MKTQLFLGSVVLVLAVVDGAVAATAAVVAMLSSHFMVAFKFIENERYNYRSVRLLKIAKQKRKTKKREKKTKNR